MSVVKFVLSAMAGHLPSGRCGLKSPLMMALVMMTGSLPFGEVWIEITAYASGWSLTHVTSLRGGVD